MHSQILFDFSEKADLRDWFIVDDGVMGGRSQGSLNINDSGHGVFQGTISLENNGGFSSVRYRFPRMTVNPNTRVVLRLKGDGKEYQIRVKDNLSTYYSYVFPFPTNGDWQEVEVPLQEMYPSFRGRRLNLPNFNQSQIAELTFLIGNKKAETFKLIIDKIEIR